MAKYDPRSIEPKWQKKWLEERVYEPDLDKAKKPFYNLMMFPYPSAEGLHVGNMYAFTGSDIYGRKKRMEGHDVFEPIGLDGFGIHSENYAIKIGTHPVDQAKKSEAHFYEQLRKIGNGFAWDERLETYKPEYYRWTQWLFVQMWKHGLAYRKKQSVNWCPKDKTVLSDEQVENGKCERCGTAVVKKELEQWSFRITKYADRLLDNLEKLDWSEKVKIAQKNWIGRSEGAEIEFPIGLDKDTNFLILHGYTGLPTKNFIPWLKKELEDRGYRVQAPEMPNTKAPKEEEQVGYVIANCKIDRNTIIIGHSLGGIVAMKVLERHAEPVAGLILVAPTVEPEFRTGAPRPFWETFSWKFDYTAIKKLASARTILSDLREQERIAYLEFLSEKLDAKLMTSTAVREHFCATEEPAILENALPRIKVFTTRPDTLFGATYLVLAPEHELVARCLPQIANRKEAEDYVRLAKAKKEEERTEEKEKTGVPLAGLKAVNPANGEEIPIWVADYVLGSYGTGAIMAVPAHDERDFAFAKSHTLIIEPVIMPMPTSVPTEYTDYTQKQTIDYWRERIKQNGPFTESGLVFNSRDFSDMDSETAKWEITKFVHGERKTQYRLRDWIISRQRYWGPPIPMIFCEKCSKEGKGEHKDMPGWYAVDEKDLPVTLPYVEDFRPTGSGVSPLATDKEFYEVKCPACGAPARRETDISDNFLDSTWYYLRYLDVHNEKSALNDARVKRWLPVNLYTGGAEHSVLHLLYVRFVAMALHDWGLVRFEEPFKKFRAHGLIIKDGAKMSKSKGNVINPDEYIADFGADALRMYLMFLAPFEQGGDFRDSGILGIERFLKRVWNFGQKGFLAESGLTDQTLLHKTIKKVTEDIENLHYNTAISALMILLNGFEENGAANENFKKFLKLLAPFAPHIAEEIWRENLKHETSIHIEPWPEYDPKLLVEDMVTIVFQVNGKVRDTIKMAVSVTKEEAEAAALANEGVKRAMGTAAPKKVIYVDKKLVNIVV